MAALFHPGPALLGHLVLRMVMRSPRGNGAGSNKSREDALLGAMVWHDGHMAGTRRYLRKPVWVRFLMASWGAGARKGLGLLVLLG